MQFPDISAYQPDIDWPTLRRTTNIVAIKVSEGIGLIDPSFHDHKLGAEAQNFDEIWYYHFAHPDLGNTPQAEANFFMSVLGPIGPRDRVFLDYELDSGLSTAAWAREWLVTVQAAYKRAGIYSYLAFIPEHLQDPALSAYPLWLAAYGAKPACPAPWKEYLAWQFTSAGTMLGIPSTVDCSDYYGGDMATIPTGWHDDGTTLTAPNGVHVVRGFRGHVLASNWDADNWPLQIEEASNPLEISNPSLGDGTWQPFRWKVLEWDDKRGVQEMWTGQELLATRKQLATANAQIATLKQELDANQQSQEINNLKDTLAKIETLAGQLL